MPKNSPKSLAVVILAAGKGKRMKSDLPKVMFDLAGWPLVRHVVEIARALRPERLVVVVGHGKELVEEALRGQENGTSRGKGRKKLNPEIVVQRQQRGTGHAVRCAEKALSGFEGSVLVLLGDVPLVPVRTLKALLGRHRRRKASATVLSGRAPDPRGYGRVLRDAKGSVLAIREDKDATAAEKAVDEVNTGILAFDAGKLWPALRKLKANNAQGEFYLTDVPGLLLSRGDRIEAQEVEDFDHVRGVNSHADLAAVSAEARRRILAGHMERGVRIVDPSTTYIERGVRIAPGATIFPFTVITGEVTVGKDCEVGPFSHLRTGTRLLPGAQVGNFVEVKKSEVGEGSKAKHLTYLGDAVIGRKTNIGCGTITANYDGVLKHRTTIGDGVHVGSGTVFVAPVKVGDDATTGAQAVVISDVGEGETVVGVPARALKRRRAKK